MKQTFLNLFYVLISLISPVLSTDFKVTKWTQYPNLNRNSMKFVGVSVGQCVDECTRRLSCGSVGYRSWLNLCEVHLEDVTPEDNADDGYYIFIKKDDMLKKKAAAKRVKKAGHVCDESTGHCHKECETFALEKGKVYGNRRHPGAKVSFLCDGGYREKNGEKSAVCQQIGEWSYYPKCKLADVKVQTTPIYAAVTTTETQTNFQETTTTSQGTATFFPVASTISPDDTSTSSGPIATSGISTISPGAPTTSSGEGELSLTISSVTTVSSQGTTTTTTSTSPATAFSGTTVSSLGTTTYSPESTKTYAEDTVTYHGTRSPSTTTTSSSITAILSSGTTSSSFEATASPPGTTHSSLETTMVSQEQTTQTLTTVFTETTPSSTETAGDTPNKNMMQDTGLSSGHINHRNVKQLLVHNGGQWGHWGNAVFCPEGSYASGYDMKIQPYEGRLFTDDTSLNAIRLYCKGGEGEDVHDEITSNVGLRGDWVGPVFCSRSNGLQFFLIAFNLQVQPSQGTLKDDIAASFVKFKCRDHGGALNSYELAKEPRHGERGSYGNWSEECLAGTAICGLETRVEESSGDKTALNDVVFYCCN